MKLLIIFFIKLILFIIAIPISIKIEKKILIQKDAEVKKLRKLLQEAVDEKNRVKCLNQDLIEKNNKLRNIIEKSQEQNRSIKKQDTSNDCLDYLKNSLSNYIKKAVEESTCSFSQATQAIGDLALACQSMSTIDTIREGQEALRNEINMAQNQMLQQLKIQQIAAAAHLIGAPYRPTSSYFTNYNYNKWWQ